MRAAEDHAPHDPGRLPSEAEDDVHDGREGEDGGEDDVGGKGGAVAVRCFLDGTKL